MSDNAKTDRPTGPDKSMEPQWVSRAKRLQALAQNGLTFAQDHYDVERYRAIQEIAAEILAAGSEAEIPVVRDLLSKETGYATPKVDVRGVVFQENRLLLVRERSDGRWTLPGGWADVCESPSESVVREVLEESGLQVRAVKLLAVCDRSKHPHEPPFPFHVYKVFILCQLTGGSMRSSSETDGVSFFAEEQMPDLSTSRVTRWQIQRCFEHHRNRALPPDFD